MFTFLFFQDNLIQSLPIWACTSSSIRIFKKSIREDLLGLWYNFLPLGVSESQSSTVMRFLSIYNRSPTSLLQSFIILLCNAGSAATVNHQLGNGQTGTSGAQCPQHQAGCVERRVCSSVTLRTPQVWNLSLHWAGKTKSCLGPWPAGCRGQTILFLAAWNQQRS